MRYSLQRAHPSASRCALAVTLFALGAACRSDDPLPTAPLLAGASSPAAAILGADVTSLGFDAAAINESGQVAGTLNGRAVLWTAGQGMLDLGTLGGTSSRAYAINSLGYVAGSSTTATGATHAFLWTPTQGMQDLWQFGFHTCALTCSKENSCNFHADAPRNKNRICAAGLTVAKSYLQIPHEAEKRSPA